MVGRNVVLHDGCVWLWLLLMGRDGIAWSLLGWNLGLFCTLDDIGDLTSLLSGHFDYKLTTAPFMDMRTWSFWRNRDE